MSNKIRLRNRSTGEIITLMRKGSDQSELTKESENTLSNLKKYKENVEGKIQERGTIGENIQSQKHPLMKGLSVAGAPFQAVESAISNPMIEMQKGNFGIKNLGKSFAEGISGKRQGQFGDVFRMTGTPEPVASSVGLGISLIGPTALTKAAHNLRRVSKFADPKTSKAINKFVKTVEGGKGALKKIGGKVNSYYDDIGKVVVDKTKFLDELTGASNIAKKSITDIPNASLQQIDDVILNLAESGKVNDVRHARSLIDDLITQWNKQATGGKLSKGQEYLMKVRSNLNKIADDAVFNFKKKQIGAKKAEKYLNNFKKARNDYSELRKGYSSIQSKMVNPKTGKPTKTGKLLNEILDTREGDLRKTLSDINKFGTGSNKFAKELSDIEKAIRLREFAGRVGQGVGYGAAVGTTIGATVGRARNNLTEGGGN